jgi:hypothetical protein
MTTTNLTITRSPHDVAAMIDRLRAAPLGDVWAALGLPAVEIQHANGRAWAFAGDGPNSADIVYSRAPMASPYDVSRTEIRIDAHDREGRALGALLTAALSA